MLTKVGVDQMNVFVLCAGRTASTTFAKAANTLDRFTAGHETNASKIGNERFDYPLNHIEVDNRLSWFLGGLDRRYGDSAKYVFLKRDNEKIAKSYLERWNLTVSIVRAFSKAVLMKASINDSERLNICRFYVETVEENIQFFLKDKSKENIFYFELEDSKNEFLRFSKWIGEEASDESLKIWDMHFNKNRFSRPSAVLKRLVRKTYRLVTSFPEFVRDV